MTFGPEEGPHDGVVSVASATHGEGVEVWDADHMNLVNRPNPRATGWGHRPSDYLRLVERVTGGETSSSPGDPGSVSLRPRLPL